MKYITILLIIIILLIPSCKKNIYKDDNYNDTQETVRFKPLSEPIEGKLYFIAGQTSTEIDSMYNKYPWDFWQLSGTEFTKINDSPWWYNDNSRFSFKWSPKANYFSFFDDKGGPIRNTDDIGLLNISTFDELYFTDLLGDAHPDGGIYKWSQDEQYIYFNALEYGVSEYDSSKNSDIYRVKPDGAGLEKLTDTPFFELSVSPNPDGNKLAYIMVETVGTPDSLVGYHVLDLNTMESKLLIHKDIIDTWSRSFWSYTRIYWHPSGNNILTNSYSNDNNRLININLNNKEIKYHPLPENWSFYELVFIPETNKIIITAYLDIATAEPTFHMFIYNLDTDEYNIITESQDLIFSWEFGLPAISPSNQYLAFVASKKSPWIGQYRWNLFNQDAEIYIMDLTDFSIIQITNGLYGYEGHLKWIE